MLLVGGEGEDAIVLSFRERSVIDVAKARKSILLPTNLDYCRRSVPFGRYLHTRVADTMQHKIERYAPAALPPF